MQACQELLTVALHLPTPQVCTACANAFAHGSNEVANSVGPLAAIYQVSAVH